jgi:midasin (ATPase involved in ribosome maturation)
MEANPIDNSDSREGVEHLRGASFLRGDLEGKSLFQVLDFSRDKDCGDFAKTLRPICEIIFDLLLESYTTVMDIYRQQSQAISKSEFRKLPSLESWDRALSHAHNALEKCRNAHEHRRTKDWQACDRRAADGQYFLAERYVSTFITTSAETWFLVWLQYPGSR